MLTKKKEQLRRPWKLRGVSESAAATVERHLILLDRDVERFRAGDGSVGARGPVAAGHRPQTLQQLVGGTGHLLSIVTPHARELGEQIREAGPAPARGRGKVGAAIERLELRREKDGHR